MISLAYCPTTGPDHALPIVVAAGDVEGAAHYHDSDALDHPCTLILDVPEDTPTAYPWATGTGAVVNSPDEWLSYLARYIP